MKWPKRIVVWDDSYGVFRMYAHGGRNQPPLRSNERIYILQPKPAPKRPRKKGRRR